jgi:hypothetical protein
VTPPKCEECGYKNATVAHLDITAPEDVHRWCVGGPCPLCGMPSLWSRAEKKCSPLSGCAAWTTTAVYDRGNRRWQPTDPDGFALDGSYVGPVIVP